MSLRVTLKLRLFSEKMIIRVRYNTFEKATFDEYLICSAILRSTSKDECLSYIDDITGDGSLNSHFKKLYEKYSGLSKESLGKIMSNSMIPTMKIDESGSYTYYPQLNMSVFRKKVYQGDLRDRIDVKSMLHIEGDIIDYSVYKKSEGEKSEPYTVAFADDGRLSFRFYDTEYDISDELFSEIAEIKSNGTALYRGTVHSRCDGTGWNIVTNAMLNALTSSRNIFYENGDHYMVKNDGVKKTVVARVHGLNVYKEELVPYGNNSDICERVLELLIHNGSLASIKTSVLKTILQNVFDIKIKQSAVDALIVGENGKDWVLTGLSLMANGAAVGWSQSAYFKMLKFATKSDMNMLYKNNPDFDYSIESLIQVDRALLRAEHLRTVNDYLSNMEQLRQVIIKIVGEVTTSGLRERAKVLTSDDDTRRFSKLCNKLIGHETAELEKATLAQLELWHKEAAELKELSLIIDKKIHDRN